MRQSTAGPRAGYELDHGDLGDPEEPPFAGRFAIGSLDLPGVWAAFFRSRLAVIAIILGALLLGLATILFSARIYEARASVQVDQQSTKVLGTEDTEPVVSGTDADRFLQTQVDVLGSRAMAKRVSDALGLGRSDSFLTAMGNRSLVDLTPAERQELVLDTLQKNLTVDLRRNSRVVGIYFRSRDAALAARIANTFSDKFIQSNIQRKFSTSDYSRQFLQGQLAIIKDRLEGSERALISYARTSRLIDASAGIVSQGAVEGPRSLVTANLVQLNAAFADAKAARLQAQQRWEQARGVPATSLPEVLSNQAVQELLQKRAELDAQLSQLRQHLRPDHPTVLQASAQLNELNRQTNALAESIRGSIRNQFLVAQRQETAIGNQVSSLKTDTLSEQDLGVQYNILKREVDTNRQLYESLLQRFKEVSAQAGVTNNNISVVDVAEVPRKPSSPRPLVNMALALLAGIVLAAVFVYVREKLDDAIRDPRDVEERLGLPLLGVIPQQADKDVLATLDNQHSELAEAYHSVRSSLELSSSQGLPRSLLVTSSNKGEGKSTTSFVLASDFARVGRRVLLVDADLRRPSLHRNFDLPSDTPGLSSVLARLIPFDQAIRSTGQENLSFMPSGPIPPDPANLFAGGALAEVLAALATRFDAVILDGPPVMALADAAELTAVVEGTIFVVEAGAAHFGQARTAVTRLRRAQGSVLGCVVTKYSRSKIGLGKQYDFYNYEYADN